LCSLLCTDLRRHYIEYLDLQWAKRIDKLYALEVVPFKRVYETLCSKQQDPHIIELIRSP